MRKYQKMGCVRYATNEAKAAELQSMGYTECTSPDKKVIIDSVQVKSGTDMEAATETLAEAVSAACDSQKGSKRKSGIKGKTNPVTDPEAPAEEPAPGGDDNGSDPTDNK